MEYKAWIDWMKWTGMLAIIWGHCFPVYFTSFLYAFSVGTFFFVSGYLTRIEPSDKKFFNKIIHSLVIPYFLLSCLKALPTLLSDKGLWSASAILLGFHSIHDIMGCGKLWFVYTLILLKIVFHFFGTTKKQRLWLLIIFTSGGIVYNLLGLDLFWAVTDTFLSMPFFLLGYTFRNSTLSTVLIDKIEKIPVIYSILLTVLLMGITFTISYLNGPAWMYRGMYGNNLFLFALSALSGISMLLFLSCQLPQKPSAVCRYIGAGSIVVLAYHQDLNHPLLKLVNQADWNALATDAATFVVSVLTILAFVPIIYVISRYFPFVIGGRKPFPSK